MLHTLSRWAAHHKRVSIALIILLEIINGYLGTLLGANLLGSLPGGVLQGGIIALIGGVIYIRLWYLGADSGPGRLPQRVKRRCMFALFFSNFLLFSVIGGIGANRVLDVQPTGSVSGTDTSVSWAVRGDSLQPVTLQPRPVPVQKLPRRVPLAVLILGYALLLGATIFLTTLLLVLGCELSCTGHGLGAVLITLLGLGVVGVLSFYWGRVITNNLIRHTIPAERSRAARRYRRVWLATVMGMLAAQALVATY